MSVMVHAYGSPTISYKNPEAKMTDPNPQKRGGERSGYGVNERSDTVTRVEGTSKMKVITRG
jgi:hypothetical protein